MQRRAQVPAIGRAPSEEEAKRSAFATAIATLPRANWSAPAAEGATAADGESSAQREGQAGVTSMAH